MKKSVSDSDKLSEESELEHRDRQWPGQEETFFFNIFTGV